VGEKDEKERGDTKALPPEMKAHVIAEVESLIARYPGKTLRQIAEEVGIEQPMLSAMRHGRSIGIMALLKLREATGKRIDALLGIEEQPKAAPLPSELAHYKAVLSQLEDMLERQRASSAPPPATASVPTPKKGTSDAPRPRRRP
jgi:transcriptional regulator with XRE-family HTH domain